jgi:hypothetical protein
MALICGDEEVEENINPQPKNIIPINIKPHLMKTQKHLSPKSNWKNTEISIPNFQAGKYKNINPIKSTEK